MTARDEWRWTDERGVQRLVGTDELRAALASSVLPPSTLVWREGMKEWAPAFTMPELASAAIAAARSEGESGSENTPTEVDLLGGRAPGTPGRGEMRTLLGLNAPEAKDRQSAPIVPIVVPTAGGATSSGRDVITQLPKFSGVEQPESSSPAIPPAPRMPGRPAAPASTAPALPGASPSPAATPLANIPKQRQRTQTMQGVGLQRNSALRTKTTSDIDSLWAAPSPGEEGGRSDAFAKPRPAAGAPAQAEIANEDTGDRPSATEVDEMEIVSERVPAPPKLPDFGARTRAAGTRPPGPPPKAPAGPRKPLSSIPPPLVRRQQPSVPPLGTMKAAPTGFESRAPGTQRPQAPPLPPKRGSERPPMKSTPPPGPMRRSHPPPPLRSRAPQPETPGRVESGIAESKPAEARAAEAADAAKAALDAVDVDLGADAGSASVDASSVVAEASRTPAPVVALETKPAVEAKAVVEAKSRVEERTPPAGKSEPAKVSTPSPSTSTSATPAASAASTTGAPDSLRGPTSGAASNAAPVSAASKAPSPARDAKDEAAAAGERGAAGPSPSAKPASVAPVIPTKHSATPAPASASSKVEGGHAPPPVAAKPSEAVTAAASLTPPPARIPIRDKADLSGTPTAPVAPRAAHQPAAARGADDVGDFVARPRKLGEAVSVPVSSLMVAGGALIVMAMTGFLVGRCSTSAAPAARALSGLQLVVAHAQAAAPIPPNPCGAALSARRWAPRASKTIPFELFATPGGKLAVGYARDDTEAGGLEINTATGDAKEAFSHDTSDPIEHVVPNPSGGFTVIAPGDSAALKSGVEVPTSPPFFVGVSDGAVVSSDKADAPGPKLWQLPSADAINSERVEQAGSKGFAYTFRQGNDVFGGWIGADRKAVGELAKIVGSGGSVGKPMSSFNGTDAAVIFADRPAGAAHWEIRVGHAPAGSIPTQTKVIPLPKGGPGGDAFAPDIAGLPDGRWLLVWTEGPPGGRAVRAQTLSRTFEPIGDPMALSPPAGNFGQGVIGVVGKRATVVFLSKGSQSYELWGAVLSCG